jgi:hypothetical protein
MDEREPVPVIPLQYASPASALPRWSAVIPWCLWAAWLSCAVAVVLIVTVRVESVLITGPVIFFLGLMAIFGGTWTRATWTLLAGVAHCGICALFVMLVNVWNWSPSDAREPFLWMGIAYTMLSLPLTIMGSRRRRVGWGAARAAFIPPPPYIPPPSVQ